jgi:hypothetical protein
MTSSMFSVRDTLLDAGLWFIESVLACPGVLGIALIGSIVTPKKNPKDIDLVLYIADDANLLHVAALARRLKGRLQAHNLGADAFLANANREYLGRTCSWKDCRPGVRASCDALHCGRRPYLHDDLTTVMLATELVREPPVEVWPRCVLRSSIAGDVKRMVARIHERHNSALNPSHSVVTARAYGGTRPARGRARSAAR